MSLLLLLGGSTRAWPRSLPLPCPRPPRCGGANPVVNGTEEEIGIGERVTASEPSGLYFLGLPLFFIFSSEEEFPTGIVKLKGGAAFSGGVAATAEADADAALVLGSPAGKGLGFSDRGGPIW